MKYCYWRGNGKPPAKLPEGCEYRWHDGSWSKESNDDTKTWSANYWRRWPKPAAKAKPKAKPEYCYWNGHEEPPAKPPKNCEYYRVSTKDWAKEDNNDPSSWDPHWERRWPKVKGQARPSVTEVLARIRKHADAGVRDYGVLAMNYIKAEVDAIGRHA